MKLEQFRRIEAYRAIFIFGSISQARKLNYHKFSASDDFHGLSQTDGLRFAYLATSRGRVSAWRKGGGRNEE